LKHAMKFTGESFQIQVTRKFHGILAYFSEILWHFLVLEN
jgi:hypothetical protein